MSNRFPWLQGTKFIQGAFGIGKNEERNKKFIVYKIGKTLNCHQQFIDRLKGQISLQQVSTVEQCDFILVFCPIVSRAGTDIEAAVRKLQNSPDTKPTVLVVLHHTFDPECVVPDSSRAVHRENTVTVDCLFHEDKGLLQCHKNNESLSTVADYINPQTKGQRQEGAGTYMGRMNTPQHHPDKYKQLSNIVTNKTEESENAQDNRGQELNSNYCHKQLGQQVVKKMKNRLEERQTEIDMEKEQVEEITKYVKINDRIISEKDEKLSEKETELKKTKKELETSKSERETLEQELQHTYKQIQELEEKNKQLEEKLVTELQMKDKTLQDKETEIRKVNKKLEKTERMLQENQTQFENKLKSVENELQTTKQKLMDKDKQPQDKDKLLAVNMQTLEKKDETMELEGERVKKEKEVGGDTENNENSIQDTSAPNKNATPELQSTAKEPQDGKGAPHETNEKKTGKINEDCNKSCEKKEHRSDEDTQLMGKESDRNCTENKYLLKQDKTTVNDKRKRVYTV